MNDIERWSLMTDLKKKNEIKIPCTVAKHSSIGENSKQPGRKKKTGLKLGMERCTNNCAS